MNITISIHRRIVSPEEAVASVTTPYDAQGVVEQLRETIELQGKLIANMLKVQFDIYDEDFSDPEHHPRTDAARLAFILGCGSATVTVSD